jgi:hypothetical protein
MLPPYPPRPTIPGSATQHASIAPAAASTALPPRSNTSRPAAAAAGWGVATAAVRRLAGARMFDVFNWSSGKGAAQGTVQK